MSLLLSDCISSVAPKHKGFFLLELMCAVALSGFVVFAVGRFIVQTYNYYTHLISSCTYPVQAFSAVSLCARIGKHIPTDRGKVIRSSGHELVWERASKDRKLHYEGIRYIPAKKRLEYCRGTFYKDTLRWSPGSCALMLYPVEDVILKLVAGSKEVYGMSCSFKYMKKKYTAVAHAGALEMEE